MTLKDLKNIKEIIIGVEPKEYKAEIVEISDITKIIAKPISTITDAWMKKPADIFFTLNNKKYTFPAFVYLPEPNKIVIIKSGEIVSDKRRQKRTEIDILPATISVKPILGLLQLSEEIEIKVVNLSEEGARIWVKEPLEEDKQYILNIILRKHKMLLPFQIKNNIGQKDGTFIYGIQFTEIADIDKKVISKYLTRLKGDKKQQNMLSIDIESMWKDVKKSF